MSMNVVELIELFRGYPPEFRVVVDGYEEGYDDLSPDQLSVARISLDTGKSSWQGKHGEAVDLAGTPSDAVKFVNALVLRRTSR